MVQTFYIRLVALYKKGPSNKFAISLTFNSAVAQPRDEATCYTHLFATELMFTFSIQRLIVEWFHNCKKLQSTFGSWEFISGEIRMKFNRTMTLLWLTRRNECLKDPKETMEMCINAGTICWINPQSHQGPVNLMRKNLNPKSIHFLWINDISAI